MSRGKGTVRSKSLTIRLPEALMNSIQAFAHSRNISPNSVILTMLTKAHSEMYFSKIYPHDLAKYYPQTDKWQGFGKVVCPYCETLHMLDFDMHGVIIRMCCPCGREFNAAFSVTEYVRTHKVVKDAASGRRFSVKPKLSWKEVNTNHR